MPRRPYPGLRPFNRDEADLFFGRDDEIDQIVDRLTSNRFLGVLGASGSGKSSLVRTGLFEALEGGANIAGSAWQIVDTRPGGEPIARLAAALSQASARPGGGEAPDRIVEALRRGPRSIVEWCEAGNLAPGTNLLVLVDQFEELFNYTDAASRGDAQVLAGLLVESARSRQVPIYVALTMRSDYFGACGAYPELAKTISESIFLTPRMLREACEEAILGPAAVLGFEIKDDLLTLLLNDLEKFAAFDGDAGQGGGQTARQADQLPLLQYALNRIWQRASVRDADNVVLTVDDYDEIGGLSGALDKQGEATIAALGVPEQAIERVFRSLVKGPSVAMATRDPHRIRQIAAIAGLDESTAEIVTAFAADDCQFLRAQTPIEPGSYVDIPHESLIRQWRKLSAWTEREGDASELWRRLAADASEWDEQGRDPEALLAGIQLVRRREWWAGANVSQAWADRYPVERASGGIVPIGLVGEYLDAGQARHEAGLAAQRRQRTRIRALIGGAALLLVMSSGAFAFYQSNVADEQTRVAAELRGSQTSLRLAVRRANDNLETAEAQTKVAEAAQAVADDALRRATRSAAEAVEQRDAARHATLLAVSLRREAEMQAAARIRQADEARLASERVLQGAATIIEKLEVEQDDVKSSALSRFEMASNVQQFLLPNDVDLSGADAALRRRYNIVLGNAALEMLGSDGAIGDESLGLGFALVSTIGEQVRGDGAEPREVAQTHYWEGRMAEVRGDFPGAAASYYQAFQDVSDEDAPDVKARSATALVRLGRLGVVAAGIDQAEGWCRSADPEGYLQETLQCLIAVAALHRAKGDTEPSDEITGTVSEYVDFASECENPIDYWSVQKLEYCADLAKFTRTTSDSLMDAAHSHYSSNSNSERSLFLYANLLQISGKEKEGFDILADLSSVNSSASFWLDTLPTLVELDDRDLEINWRTERPRPGEQLRSEQRKGADSSAQASDPIVEGVRISATLISVLEKLEMVQAPHPLSPSDETPRSWVAKLADARTRLGMRMQHAKVDLLWLISRNAGLEAVVPDTDSDRDSPNRVQIEEVQRFLDDLYFACLADDECAEQVDALWELPEVKRLFEPTGG